MHGFKKSIFRRGGRGSSASSGIHEAATEHTSQRLPGLYTGTFVVRTGMRAKVSPHGKRASERTIEIVVDLELLLRHGTRKPVRLFEPVDNGPRVVDPALDAFLGELDVVLQRAALFRVVLLGQVEAVLELFAALCISTKRPRQRSADATT